MSTPPFDPNARPQDQPPYPGQPNQGGWTPQGPAQPGYNPYSPGYGFNYAPPGQLAGWGSRVGASLLDYLVAAIPVAIGWVVGLVLANSLEEMGQAGTLAVTIGYLGFFAIHIWNRVVQQGRTGQSLGKRIVGLKVVSPDTGQLIGIGRTFGREVCAVIFNYVCFLNLLWPLWDERHQTWHDKVASDIVIRL